MATSWSRTSRATRWRKRLGDALRDDWREEYVAIKGEVAPLPGAAELIHRLADSGFKVALASSGDPEFADEASTTSGSATTSPC